MSIKTSADQQITERLFRYKGSSLSDVSFRVVGVLVTSGVYAVSAERPAVEADRKEDAKKGIASLFNVRLTQLGSADAPESGRKEEEE